MSEYRVVCADGSVALGAKAMALTVNEDREQIVDSLDRLGNLRKVPCGPHRVEQFVNGEWVEVNQ